MKYIKVTFFIFIFTFLDTTNAVEYERPKKFDFITNIPNTMKESWEMSFNTEKETLWVWSGVISSSILLYIYDEEILAEFQRWGRDLGLGNSDNTKDMVKVNSYTIFRGPTDVGSSFYYLGDGWTHGIIAASFLATGAMNDDNRAFQTGNQIIHGMVTSTISNQIIKRATGRESPYRKTKDRGAWRPFPSFNEYNNNVSKYDAMPTGHLMTATMTFTVIDTNYPEYRSWFRPLGFTWLTLLGFQMVNNGVHWASDYPLGIAMGYVYGKVASRYGKVDKEKESSKDVSVTDISKWEIYPILQTQKNDRVAGLLAQISF